MSKIVSFEKFVVLKEAGLSEQQAKALHHINHLHSASESFVTAVATRATQGKKPRW